MRRFLLLAGSLLLTGTFAAPAASQHRAGEFGLGSRIRISPHGGRGARYTGELLSVQRDSVTLRGARGVSTTVPLPDNARVEWWRGRQREVLRGAGIGFVAGYVVGAVQAARECSEGAVEVTEFLGVFCTVYATSYYYGPIGGLVGLLAGASLGALVRTDRWARISASAVRATLSARPSPEAPRLAR